ncbi:MAG TPA: nuclear transport factor 2 family protein [Acidimicrobiia bacterium]|nr:nuclear transport factor 2 family protein [Acidimicrobiia bacterium]
MEEHPNVAKYREVHEKFATGDYEAIFEVLADDVVWHQIGGPTLHGKEAVRETWAGIEGAGVEFDVDLHDVVGNDEHVIGLVEARVGMGGDSFTYRTAEIAHMKDGKVIERWAFSDDTQRITDFFNSLGG